MELAYNCLKNCHSDAGYAIVTENNIDTLHFLLTAAIWKTEVSYSLKSNFPLVNLSYFGILAYTVVIVREFSGMSLSR